MDRDVMKADDIPLFILLAAFITKCWKMLATDWEKTPLERQWRTTHFPPKWPGVIKTYLFEIKPDFLDRTVYW